MKIEVVKEIRKLARKLDFDDAFLIYMAREWAKDINRGERTNMKLPQSINDVYNNDRLSRMLRGYLRSLVKHGVHELASGLELKELFEEVRRAVGKFPSGSGLEKFYREKVYPRVVVEPRLDPYDTRDWRDQYQGAGEFVSDITSRRC